MNLQENEKILLELKPSSLSIKYFFISRFWHGSLVIMIMAITFFSKMEKNVITFNFINAMLITSVILMTYFILGWFFIKKVVQSYNYIITNQRCILKYGFLYLNRRDISYPNINDINLKSNITEKIFGLGSVYLNDINTSIRANTRISNNTCRMEGLTLIECERVMDLISENIQKYKDSK
ncbi:PH domain-containing protein [Francisella hispaniensis]|nr:PH domain-containing protein [Francisella hispaniensis]